MAKSDTALVRGSNNSSPTPTGLESTATTQISNNQNVQPYKPTPTADKIITVKMHEDDRRWHKEELSKAQADEAAKAYIKRRPVYNPKTDSYSGSL
jgi:hypothetical protein